MFTNGVPVATISLRTWYPPILRRLIFIWQSQWPADPYFSGCLSSVRSFQPLSPQSNHRPQITILQPALGSVYIPGSTISFAGSANDFMTMLFQPPAWTGPSLLSTPDQQTWFLVWARELPVAPLASLPPAREPPMDSTDHPRGRGFGRSHGDEFRQYLSQRAGQPLAWSSHYPFTNGFQDVNGSYNAHPKRRLDPE